jgi:hypothetical protein
MVRLILQILGGMAIVAVFFLGTLFILGYQDLKYPDSVRAAQAKSLKAALEKYRKERGSYPFPFPDVVLPGLKKELVDGKYLDAIPEDPVWGLGDNQYRYVSYDGKSYGLLFHLQFPYGKIVAGGRCLTGVGTAGTKWWGQPPDCPF